MTVQSIVEQSVGLAAEDRKQQAGILTSIATSWAVVGELLPPWWSAARDRALRGAWKDDGFLSAFMSLGRSKLSSIPMTIEAVNTSVAAHVQQAHVMTRILNSGSEFGEGWVGAIDKCAEDYLGSDNGMFMEVVADGPKNVPISGPVLSVVHRDSSRCQRTGDPVYPVIYTQRTGERVVYHWTRIIFMSENRSGDISRNGVGYCAVSRSVKIAHGMMAALNYRLEKMGVRPLRRILVGKNIEGSEILQTILAAESIMTEIGLQNFVQTVAIGGQDIDLKAVDLSHMDDFSEKDIFETGLQGLALAWGFEINEVFQLTGGQASSEVSLQRSRYKLPQRFITNFLPQAWKLVPDHLTLKLDFVDDQLDHQRAMIDDISARNAHRNLQSGVTTRAVERRKMFDTGRVTGAEFRQMQLSEGLLEDDLPVGALFFNPRYAELLLIPRELLVPSIVDDVQTALAMIEANIASVYAVLGTSSSQAVVRRALEALAALEWLKGQYTFKPREELAEPLNRNDPPPDQERDEEQDERDEEENGREDNAPRDERVSEKTR